MSKFKTLAWGISMEVPFFELEEQEDISQFSSKISSVYPTWMEVLRSRLDVTEFSNTDLHAIDSDMIKTELQNMNSLITYYIVIRIDEDHVLKDMFEVEWSNFKSTVKSELENLMNNRKLMYKIYNYE